MAKGSKTKTKQEQAIRVVERESQELVENLQHYDVADPRQALFLRLYYDRESPTWGNAKRSAMAAGFDEDYASQITYRKPAWWLDFVRQQSIADLIEQHVHEVLSLPAVTQAMGAFGPLFTTEEVMVEKTYKNGKTRMVKKKIKTPIFKPDASIIKEKTAVMKIAAPAHNPEKYGRDKRGTNNFFFDMRQTRERYT